MKNLSMLKTIWNKGIWTLFLPISQKQYGRHPTHSSWSCHICSCPFSWITLMKTLCTNEYFYTIDHSMWQLASLWNSDKTGNKNKPTWILTGYSIHLALCSDVSAYRVIKKTLDTTMEIYFWDWVYQTEDWFVNIDKGTNYLS